MTSPITAEERAERVLWNSFFGMSRAGNRDLIASAIRDAENEAIERAATAVLDFVPDPKLTPSQSYAAMRRGDHTDRLFDRRATAVCISQKIRALKSPSPKEQGHE